LGADQLVTRILLNARLQEAIKRVSDEEFEQKLGGIIDEALLDEYYGKEEQLELKDKNITEQVQILDLAEITAQAIKQANHRFTSDLLNFRSSRLYECA